MAGETIILHEGLSERQRTTSAGVKSRFTMTIDATPILHQFDETKLGEGPAKAIGEAIRAGIRAITEVAKPATLRAREVGKRALERGARWAVKRYAGGRTGAKPPSGSTRLFNDSGRLADGVAVRQNTAEKNWTVNVTANRLDPSTFKSRGEFLAMFERLREHVPALKDPGQVPAVATAIKRGIRDVLIREQQRTDDLKAQRAKAVLALIGI